MVNLELYRVFYAVAKCGSLTKAAEELYISQPAVSQSIKQIEAQLGGTVFNRTHRGMELSETGGKQIFSLVEQALKLLDSAEVKFNELKNTAKGVVRICASDTVINHYLLPVINEYHNKYPDVKIIITNTTSQEAVETLKSGKADLGIVNLPLSNKELVLSGKIMELNDIFVCSPDFEFNAEQPLPLSAISDYPLLMLESSTSTRKAIVEYANSLGVDLHPDIEVAGHEVLIQLAKIGLGIACIPREYIKDLLDNGELVEIRTEPAMPTRALGLVIPDNNDMNFCTKEFINLIR